VIARAIARDETPSIWQVARLFRCSICHELFAWPRMGGLPIECPECKASFTEPAKAHA